MKTHEAVRLLAGATDLPPEVVFDLQIIAVLAQHKRRGYNPTFVQAVNMIAAANRGSGLPPDEVEAAASAALARGPFAARK